MKKHIHRKKKKISLDKRTYTAEGVSSMLGVKLRYIPKYMTPTYPKCPTRPVDLYTRDDIRRAMQNTVFSDMVKASSFLSESKNIADIHALFDRYSAQYYMAKARELDRKFILHVGPTNSGKTYDAIERLIAEGDGTYLAPLRLLALEMYDKLNMAGVPCELLTGEEHEEMPGANAVASTIEMCDYGRHYKIAVIDEAQMIADPDRGAQWTKAICMVDADEVHICMAPEAEMLIRSMITDFGGTCEVVRHTRLAPLKWTGDFKDISDIQPGDALIVFSRRSVLELSAALSDRGIDASVIYGALPPMSRREEVRRFTEGRTKCVVATDAIGMGVSIPIKRIVFMETWKFDGKTRRKLSVSEVKQIAGRAGRYGLYDEGQVATADNFPGAADRLKAALKCGTPAITSYTIPFPGELVESGFAFKDLFREWRTSDTGLSYATKAQVDSMELLYNTLAPDLPTDADRALVFSLITCPAYESEPQLLSYWHDCAIAAVKGMTDDILPPTFDTSTLEGCELQYRGIDIYHQVMRRIGCDVQDLGERNRICAMINRFLEEDIGKYAKRCVICGKKLPFTRRKTSCNACYDEKMSMTPPWWLGHRKNSRAYIPKKGRMDA